MGPPDPRRVSGDGEDLHRLRQNGHRQGGGLRGAQAKEANHRGRSFSAAGATGSPKDEGEVNLIGLAWFR